MGSEVFATEVAARGSRELGHALGVFHAKAILALVRSGRPDEAAEGPRRFVAWGPGPHASQALMLACRARALIDGRFAPSVDDVLALAPPVLRHRMAVSFAGRAEGVAVAQVIEQMTMPLR